MLEVVPTRCGQGGLQFVEPFLVGPGESPDLIRAKITSAEAEGASKYRCQADLVVVEQGVLLASLPERLR